MTGQTHELVSGWSRLSLASSVRLRTPDWRSPIAGSRGKAIARAAQKPGQSSAKAVSLS